MTDAVVLISGGLDSVTLLYHVVKEIKCEVAALSFHYGQKHARELTFAEHHCIELKVPCRRMDLGSIFSSFKPTPADDSEVEGDPQPSVVVPFRNLIFLSAAFGYAESLGARLIFYGAQYRDSSDFWDCTIQFVRQLQMVANLNRKHQISMKAPFAEATKSEVVKIGQRLGVDFSQTWTCYVGTDKPCGQCPTCEERRVAFETAGVKDPLARE